MTSDETGLRRSRNPEDWLVLADWLEEHDRQREADLARRRALGWLQVVPPLVRLATVSTSNIVSVMEAGKWALLAWKTRKQLNLAIEQEERVPSLRPPEYGLLNKRYNLIPDHLMTLDRRLGDGKIGVQWDQPRVQVWLYLRRRIDGILADWHTIQGQQGEGA